MPFAATFVRSAGSTTIAFCVGGARNDQVLVRREPPVERPDAVLRAVSDNLASRLWRAPRNDNAGAVGRAGDARRPHRRPRAADPDGDIIALIDRGDANGAIYRMVQRHGPTVRRFCCDALHDAALADDVYQQVFIEAFRDLSRFQRRASVKVWLFAITRHRVLDAVKKRRSARNYFADSIAAAGDAVDIAPSAAECLDEARLHAALLASVDELPAAARSAVLAHYEQGLTFAEIARSCRERSGTLCARVARALPVLRRRIEARLGSPP